MQLLSALLAGIVAASPTVGAAPGASGQFAAVHAGPSDLQGTVTGSTVTLTWSDPGDGADSWVVEVGSSGGLTNLAQLDTGSPTPGFMTTSVPAGTYFVRVRGRQGAVIGAASNEIILTVASGPAPCGLPAAPANLTSTVTGSSVTLRWTGASGANGYVIEAGSASGASDVANADVGAATSATATAAPGTYFVRIRGRNSCGLGGASNEVPVVVGGAPAPGPGPAPCTPTEIALTAASVRIGGTIADSDCAAPHRSGHRADLFSFQGLPGTVISLSMFTGIMSSNPYIILVAPDGSVIREATGFLGNSFMSVQLPTAGTYTIEATSLLPGGRFAYTLDLRCSSSSANCH